MDPGNVSAIISASAVISGVVVGNVFILGKEWWIKRNKVAQDTTYLAIIVASHLDRLATGCLVVSQDDGTSQGKPSGKNGHCEATTVPPEFRPLELDVDWRLLPKGLMYSILRLPDQQDQLQGNLAGIWDFDFDPPEHIEYFQARRRGYAALGLQASDAAKKLLSHSGLPVEESSPGEWSRDQCMKDVISDIDAKRSAYLLQNATSAEL
jgi:hypothetical protein